MAGKLREGLAGAIITPEASARGESDPLRSNDEH